MLIELDTLGYFVHVNIVFQWHSQGPRLYVQRRSSRPSPLSIDIVRAVTKVQHLSLNQPRCIITIEPARSTRQKKNGSPVVATVKLHPSSIITAGRHLQGLLINRFISRATIHGPLSMVYWLRPPRESSKGHESVSHTHKRGEAA